MSDFDTWHFNPIATKGQICYKYANLLSKCELLPAEVRETEKTKLKANMLKKRVRRRIWRKTTTKEKRKKTQQNKQKHNKNVERGSEEVDMAKKYNKTKQEKRAKMLKERVKR